ncbi:hypothetical protein Tco_0895531 [Tanacetum coccineum]|uniref:Uncharacterized protein n=1 Tax=Tanacetum coccineum TaxID=301880 RepID=A0ABQ5CG16_9ASTR
MPTKIELTLEQSQQGVSNDVLVPVCSSLQILNQKVHKSRSRARRDQIINLIRTQLGKIGGERAEWEGSGKRKRSYALSWKPCQGDSLNLPDHRFRRRCYSLIPAKSDS